MSQIPIELFTGHKVLQEARRVGSSVSPDHVSDVLDAVVRLIRRRCPGCDGEGSRVTIDPDERVALPELCGRCGGAGTMRPGRAIQQTYAGIPDFPGDSHPVTVSPGGPGKLVDCLKCVKCGHSVTP